jgi:hypothetical protein
LRKPPKQPSNIDLRLKRRKDARYREK